MTSNEAYALYKSLHKGFSSATLQSAEDMGMIPKRKLVDGALYLGHCRSNPRARWDAKKQCFVCLRTKFGNTYREDVNHPEDDIGFDIFVPMRILNENPENDNEQLRDNPEQCPPRTSPPDSVGEAVPSSAPPVPEDPL